MLTEQLADAKDEMLRTFEVLERHSISLKACADQLSRSHRCWPSRWGWGGFLVCLVYAIFMHSIHFESHQKPRAIETALMDRIVSLDQRVVLLERPAVPVAVPVVQKKPWWHRQ